MQKYLNFVVMAVGQNCLTYVRGMKIEFWIIMDRIRGLECLEERKINLLTTCSSNIAVICIGPSILSNQETGMGGSWNSQNFRVSLGGMVCILEGKDARGGLNSKLC